jgi:hypothetical protein
VNGLLSSAGELLVESHRPFDAADDLMSRRVNLPALPALVETVERNESALRPVIRVALLIGIIPFHPGEFGLGDGRGAGAKVDRMADQRIRHEGIS